jgi:hypothetical protein
MADKGRSRWMLGLGLAGAVTALAGAASIAPAQAQSLFDQLFQSAPSRAPASVTVDPGHARSYEVDRAYNPERARAARALRKARQGKARYAGLPQGTPKVEAPKAEPAVKPVKGAPQKGAILDTKGALKAIMEDPTLRPGDIVMFPNGPMVFAGTSGTRHRMSSFEPADRSRLLPRSTAALLAGVTAPAVQTKTVRLRGKTEAAKLEAPASDPGAPRIVYQDALVRR